MMVLEWVPVVWKPVNGCPLFGDPFDGHPWTSAGIHGHYIDAHRKRCQALVSEPENGGGSFGGPLFNRAQVSMGGFRELWGFYGVLIIPKWLINDS